jgi:HEAT repeat protein
VWVRDDWRDWRIFYGLGIVIGFALGVLWARLAIPGPTPHAASPKRTWRKIALAIALALAVAGTSLVITPVRFAAVGWWRGEKFYHGLPASYWLFQLKAVCEPVKVQPDAEGLVAIFGGLAVDGYIKIVAEDIGKDAVPGLVDMLNDPNPTVRMVAVRALHRIGLEAAEAAPALIDAAKHDKESRVRFNAALALVEIEPGAKSAVPILIESLKDNNLPWGGKDRAIGALGNMGPDAKDAIPTLIELIASERSAYGAAEALKKIAPEQAAAALTDVLTHDKQPLLVRFRVALALVDIGPGAKSAVPTLIESLRDASLLDSFGAGARNSACEALGKIGPDARDATPMLIVLIREKTRTEASSALEALKKIDPEAAAKHAVK